MADAEEMSGFACRASIGDILLIGEQLRIQMHTDNPYLIKDRRFRLKMQSCCFVGSETVDWLSSTGQVPDRELAALLLNILVENKIIRHVINETGAFGDDSQYYRFRKDEGTFPYCEDLNIFLRGQKLYNRLFTESCGDVIKQQEEEGELYNNVFQGCQLIDWMIKNEEASSREEATKILRRLLQSDVIRHVTDAHHFKDEPLMYQFKIDFGRPRILLDLILPPPEVAVSSVSAKVPKTPKTPKTPTKSISASGNLSDSSKSSPSIAQDIPRSHSGNTLRTPHRTESGYHSDQADFSSSPCPDASPELFSPRLGGIDDFTSNSPSFNSGMLIRSATIDELEDPGSPYYMKHLRVGSDDVGFGFVIRGDGPVYVKTVDPTGPAAAAGLKVGQFIHSVNDQKVLHMNHRALAHVVLENMDNLNLHVMVHHHDRRK